MTQHERVKQDIEAILHSVALYKLKPVSIPDGMIEDILALQKDRVRNDPNAVYHNYNHRKLLQS